MAAEPPPPGPPALAPPLLLPAPVPPALVADPLGLARSRGHQLVAKATALTAPAKAGQGASVALPATAATASEQASAPDPTWTAVAALRVSSKVNSKANFSVS